MTKIPCRNSTVQNYECCVVVGTPFSKKISIDACLAKELFWLWDQGIVTVGSCCGKHANAKCGMAYIQVSDEFIKKMKELGYEEDKNYKFKPCNSFKPISL